MHMGLCCFLGLEISGYSIISAITLKYFESGEDNLLGFFACVYKTGQSMWAHHERLVFVLFLNLFFLSF